MKRTLALAALCLLAVFAVPTAANAASPATELSTTVYGPQGCATITPVSVAQGGTATFTCDRTFDPGTPVEVVVSGPGCHLPPATPATDPAATTGSTSTPTPAPAAAGGQVRISAPFQVPADQAFSVNIETSKTASGTCTVTATQGTIAESASFTVTERAFAETGFTGASLIWVGGGLFIAGIAVYAVFSKRRRNA
ncbi:hypothetical protein ACL9RL_01530 [Plantibacter sp. Mn2098]|uniref:hypothetical protein n=1 Tax=Plantibacter sp. Mn2098 TaxID=3395266 RepID=UPI003BBB2366